MKKIFQVLLASLCSSLSAAGISGLTAEFRNGQVFLQWKETGLPEDARLSVWYSEKPLRTLQELNGAKCAASLLNPGSARDWWLDSDSFIIPKKENRAAAEEIFAGKGSSDTQSGRKNRGFVIQDHGSPISPEGGLHVHTPSNSGTFYFAVTWQKGIRGMVRGIAGTEKPIAVQPGKPAPIALKDSSPKQGSGKEKALMIQLHGRGGGVGVDSKGNPRGNFLFFPDKSMGWREGLAVKFDAVAGKEVVTMTLNDRVWIGRFMQGKEVSDGRDRVKAISTFWLGYNTNIAVSNLGPDFKVDNYSEKIILFLIRWAQEFLGTDPARTYVRGGSMGGTGAVQLALHYPDVIAAVSAAVPIYSYTWRKTGKIATSAWRLQCSCGPFTEKNPARMTNGMDLLEYGSGEKIIARPEIDFPPIFAGNGRKDLSMPWGNNPFFYKAADQAKQALHVYWNDGDHGMTRSIPADMRVPWSLLSQYRLDRAFPAFSGSSDNRNPGNGDPADGDIRGWFNRGFRWEPAQDEKESFSMVISVKHPEIVYPVTADVTFRRRQNFRPAPGSRIEVTVQGKKTLLTVPANGIITVEKVVFPDGRPVKITLKKAFLLKN